MATNLKPQQLLTRQFPAIDHDYALRDTALYALALGLGDDPVDDKQLRYVYEGIDGGALCTIPTMANVLAYPGFWAREPDTGIDWKRLVHAEQEIILHAPIPASGSVVGRNRVSAIWDKGEGKGALLQQQRQIYDASDDRLLATVIQLSLLRGDGNFGPGGSEGAPPAPHQIPERVPDAVCDLPTLSQTALIYRLCGDMNPLHADPGVAKAAGFDRPILHGMATMGIAAHAVMRRLLDYDAGRIARMRVRFTAAAYPGDTLRTEIWAEGNCLTLRTIALERQVVVLNNCLIELG
ncbi:3-alpha,7-alpha,12-alpha-trihydroxy-5-beta-cholest-24-enoyl-CoA hydratase [Pollutimonas nitritireducens]|uniref:3-alpha,7-alpha, 12-alpha-trihydroxy-5-beta-cholest-24-enoyl-CoA hydratase n=1 Tax=Pollutimonas nitritireducens TaxID=2045209 RepID=A0A2N4UG39_9BURK|nr:MaoC/PaaZ C-terminal domain-containing protein [Pollutimonas nitritireducens]PLC53988.1 3-alpha,7-alpha,12-alpha-trihydroxy-5-beta-cholest-24-enoyl-CoA hydratase [Pollutimonas nitritireducens]